MFFSVGSHTCDEQLYKNMHEILTKTMHLYARSVLHPGEIVYVVRAKPCSMKRCRQKLETVCMHEMLTSIPCCRQDNNSCPRTVSGSCHTGPHTAQAGHAQLGLAGSHSCYSLGHQMLAHPPTIIDTINKNKAFRLKRCMKCIPQGYLLKHLGSRPSIPSPPIEPAQVTLGSAHCSADKEGHTGTLHIQ